MCGIAGIFNYSSRKPADRVLASQMTNAIAHRGPDDEGQYFFDSAGVYLGHRRLSIIDLHDGRQPMTNENEDVWIIFNGEIYNFPDLREELESCGHIFKTRSDTETIIHAYEQWGLEAFSRLNGMFAFALWDERKRVLVMTRDPYGIKPLYYWDDGQTLVFGSEVKSILYHPKVERHVNLEALSEFLLMTYVPSPKIAFSGINKLLPGHALLYTCDGTHLYRFYNKKTIIADVRSEDEIISELRNKIVSATRRQMISDVPVGAMLSGGVDSTTLATIMADVKGGSIKTFTTGFEGDFKYNELAPSKSVSEKIGSIHHEEIASADDYINLLPLSIWHLEEPVATPSTVAFYMICRLAAKHVKVVLSGQGADEAFAGYPRHLGERYGLFYRALPEMMRKKLIAPLVSCLPRNEQLKRAVGSLHEVDPLKRMVKVYNTIDPNLVHALYRDECRQTIGDSVLNAASLWQSDVKDLDGLSQMLYVDSRFSLPDNLLMYSDKMSMAVSLEVRVPYLDLELMQYVESIPSSLKIKGLTQKYVLKQAVSKWIPTEIIKRKKIGFTTPVDTWFQRQLSLNVKDRLLADGSACTMFFNPDVIQTMLNDHQRKRHDYKRILFGLLTFEIWFEQFIKPAHWTVR